MTLAMANQVAAIEQIVADAFALMRQRLEAHGIEVTHVIAAVAPDGTGIFRSNAVPGALRELVDLGDILKAIGEPGTTPSTNSRN